MEVDATNQVLELIQYAEVQWDLSKPMNSDRDDDDGDYVTGGKGATRPAHQNAGIFQLEIAMISNHIPGSRNMEFSV